MNDIKLDTVRCHICGGVHTVNKGCTSLHRLNFQKEKFGNLPEADSINAVSTAVGEHLLPCPFCGGEGKLECNDDPRLYQYYIHCMSCGADGGWCKTEKGAFRHWNMRTSESE